MFKRSFWLGSTLFAVLLGLQVSLFSPIAFAQSEVNPSPNSTPNELPQTQRPVSEQELTQFVSAWPKLGQIEQSFRQSAGEIVREEGLTLERFSNILTALQNQSEPTPALTDEEQDKFNNIISRIESLRQQTQTQMQNVLQSEELAPERFSEIYNTIRVDESLKAKVQQMLEGNSSSP